MGFSQAKPINIQTTLKELLYHTKNMNKFMSLLAVAALSVAAPQYGGGGSSSQAAPSRVPQAPAAPTCRTDYVTVWDTRYVESENEVCNTVYVDQCNTLYRNDCRAVPRQVCNVVQKKQCSTVYNKVCVTKYKTETNSWTESECKTEYKDDCTYQWEGQGDSKVWAVVPGTCKSNPYDSCNDVQKSEDRQVPYQDCNDVPSQKCVNVPENECNTVTEQVCDKVPYQKCDQVPKTNCDIVHKKEPERFSKRVSKKVCGSGSSAPSSSNNFGNEFANPQQGGSGSGYGSSNNGQPATMLTPSSQSATATLSSLSKFILSREISVLPPVIHVNSNEKPAAVNTE